MSLLDRRLRVLVRCVAVNMSFMYCGEWSEFKALNTKTRDLKSINSISHASLYSLGILYIDSRLTYIHIKESRIINYLILILHLVFRLSVLTPITEIKKNPK